MSKQKGNSVLELLLFLPIALFFLFVVIDAGLSLIQKAAINDAFRSGVNSLPAYVKSEQNNYPDREQLYTQVVSRLAQEISSNVSEVYSTYDSSAGGFEVLANLYRVSIDPLSGKTLSLTPELVASFKQGQLSNANLLKSFASIDDYLDKVFSADLLNAVSSYAEPLAYINSPVDSAISVLSVRQLE